MHTAKHKPRFMEQTDANTVIQTVCFVTKLFLLGSYQKKQNIKIQKNKEFDAHVPLHFCFLA